MNKQFVLALVACGALGGLAGCSEGDSATIVIDAPTNNDNSDNSCSGENNCNEGGGDNGGGDNGAADIAKNSGGGGVLATLLASLAK